MRLIALPFLTLLVGGCDTRQNFALPEWTDSRMLRQPREEAYGEGVACLNPELEGTVDRAATIGPDVLLTGLVDGQEAVDIPVPCTRALLDEGKRSFYIVCAACHGVLGDGNSVVASKMQIRPPPSLIAFPIASLPPGRVFRDITQGYGLMMSMKPLLTPRARWAVVAYVKALTLSQSASIASLTARERQTLEDTP